MVSKEEAFKSLLKMAKLEPESPFLDEEAYDLPTDKEAQDYRWAEAEVELETPFALSHTPAQRGYAPMDEEAEDASELQEIEGRHSELHDRLASDQQENDFAEEELDEVSEEELWGVFMKMETIKTKEI